MDARFEQVAARFEQVDARFEQVDARLGKIEARLGNVETQVIEQGVEIRRHFDVVAEQLRSDIRTFADSVAAGERRLAAMSSENVTLLSALSDHELRLRVLEGQQGRT